MPINVVHHSIKALIFIGFLFIHPYGFSQKSKKTIFKEILADNSTGNIDSILIIGTGPTATRIFLDDLVIQLSKKVNTKKVVTTYMYMGKENESLNAFLDTFKNENYKVIMVFKPQNQASLYADNRRETMFMYTGSFLLVSSGRQDKLKYEGEFFIELLENSPIKRVFWKASLKVHIDPRLSYSTKKISTWIFSSFRRSKYL